jgi:hypothetical protein
MTNPFSFNLKILLNEKNSFRIMDEDADLKCRQEALMQSIKSVFLQMFIFDGAMAILLICAPIYFLGLEAFHDGMPLTLLPFFGVLIISHFVYFNPKMQNWKKI